MIELEIKGKPEPWASHQGYGRRSYDPRSSYKKTSRMQIRAQYKGPIIETSVCICLYFYLPIPKSTSKKAVVQILKYDTPHMHKPDLDNLNKCAIDILKGIIIKDDNIVTFIRSEKHYSDNPRTVMIVTQDRKLILSKL